MLRTFNPLSCISIRAKSFFKPDAYIKQLYKQQRVTLSFGNHKNEHCYIVRIWCQTRVEWQ